MKCNKEITLFNKILFGYIKYLYYLCIMDN
uniref:Uncharacterized protein n=1 Tax=Geladintestivirus 1 TaxID=3233133 RepID=A0AAU8MHD1_9CAUD